MSEASSVVVVAMSRNSLGKEFHSLGPSTEKPERRLHDNYTTLTWPK